MEEVEIVEEERESRGSEVNAERETEREKRKLCQAVGSEQFLCLSTVSCVSVCVYFQVRCVGGTPLYHHPPSTLPY